MKTNKIIYTILISTFIFTTSILVIASEMGSPELVINGGSRGDVNFPHKMHQETLSDCSVCHNIFPKEEGSIDKLKKEKTLKRKQVMDDVCLACHRADRKAGKEYGPTSCNDCHSK